MQQTTNRTYVSPVTEVHSLASGYLMELAGSPTAPQPSQGAPIRHPIEVYG